jgi:hypothetical protein
MEKSLNELYGDVEDELVVVYEDGRMEIYDKRKFFDIVVLELDRRNMKEVI